MGFSTRKAFKGASSTTAELEKQAGARTAANRAAADDDMSSIRKSMSDTAASRVAKKAAAPSMSFSEAFRAARKDKGAGSTFTWKGKSYSTNTAGEGASKPAARRASDTTPAKSAAPAKPATSSPNKSVTPVPTPSAGGPGSLFMDKPEYKQSRSNTPGALSRVGSAIASDVATSQARGRAAIAAQEAAKRARAAPKKPEWVSGAKPSGGRLLLKDPGAKKGGAIKKYAKGGSVDGIAIRGKTRAKLRNK